MKKLLGVFAGTAIAVSMSMTAFAGQWVSDSNGWRYQMNDGLWPVSVWQWIDGDNDGTAECYYFDENGYIVVDTEIGGHTVNVDGAWTVGGIVQTQTVTNSDHEPKIWRYDSEDGQIIYVEWGNPFTVSVFGYGEEGEYSTLYYVSWVEENVRARGNITNSVGTVMGYKDFIFYDGGLSVETYDNSGNEIGSFQDGEYTLAIR